MLTFLCQDCGYQKNVKNELSGKQVRCPKCKTAGRVPTLPTHATPVKSESGLQDLYWSVFDGIEEHGQISERDFEKQLKNGWVLPSFMVKHDIHTDGVWKPGMEVNAVARHMPAGLVAQLNVVNAAHSNNAKLEVVTSGSSGAGDTFVVLGVLGTIATICIVGGVVLFGALSPSLENEFRKSSDSYNDAIRDSMRRTSDTYNEEIRRSMRETNRTLNDSYRDAMNGY